uniref:Uncharacterized protein n=1 Tax=Sinocyclocheilus rhinocerous TaxID=307959 RepID=A0A673H813_9TELE
MLCQKRVPMSLALKRFLLMKLCVVAKIFQIIFPVFVFFLCRLNNNSITAEGCSALTSVFISNPSNLIELDLSGNKLGNTGIKMICVLLRNPQCSLKKLKCCGLTEESCSALATVLRSNSSLKELDLSNNNLQDSGCESLELNLSEQKLGDKQMDQIAALLRDKHCKLNTLM